MGRRQSESAEGSRQSAVRGRQEATIETLSFKLGRNLGRRLRAIVVVIGLLATATVTIAQSGAGKSAATLPSVEKIVGDYVKITGGKKRHKAVRDATYEWSIHLKDQEMGRAETHIKAPGSTRTRLIFGNGEILNGVGVGSAWTRGFDGVLRTLTDSEAGAAKIQAALTASRLIDYKKSNVFARAIMVEDSAGERTYIVEFSTKQGARIRNWFGTKSKLLLKSVDDLRGTTVRYSDYRAQNGLLEPHRVEVAQNEKEVLIFLLRSARYNTGLVDSLFEPPSGATPDIARLLMEVEENQKKLDDRVADYAFTEKRIERKINDKGEVKEERVTVYEIYPLPGGGAFYKVISENGVPISAERAAKQDKKIAEDVAKYEAEREKREEKKKAEAAKPKGPVEKKKEDGDDVSVAVFLRACDFISPRREQLRGRDVVVFDFRPRAGFRPKTTAENVVTKLVGAVWIDPVDKVVVRLEAKLAESYKIAGGLFASIRPGAAFTFEQTRMAEGVWLPRLAQINFSARVLLFKSIEANETREFSDYRRFDAEASDYKLGAPAQGSPAVPKP